MFEEKIKLNPVEINNVVEKDIYGQKVKFNKYLDQESCIFIIEECVNKFIESNNGQNSFIISMNEAIRTMNIYLCYLTTNIDLENIAYEDLYAMGIFKAIEETLLNYNEIKNLVISCTTILFDYVIYDTLEKLPTSKQMEDNLAKINDVFKSNPEKAKEFANVIMANHPELKGFGEILENFLNNLNKKQ